MEKRRIMSQRNRHGIKGASCLYKTVDNEGVRICEEMQLKVEQQFVCKKWVMSDGLKNAGRSGGKLKVIRKTLVDEEIY